MKHKILISILAAGLTLSAGCTADDEQQSESRDAAKTETVPSTGTAIDSLPAGTTLAMPRQDAHTPAPGEDLYEQSMRAFESGDARSAFQLCLKSAEAGFAPAQFNVAIFYYNGEGTTQDRAATVHWLERAARQGHIRAIMQLAECCRYGIGTKRDEAAYARWIERAAAAGDAQAQYKTGTAYYRGIGVIPDYEQAVKWYTKAANQGVSEAENDLGLCYENGLGVPRLDPNRALRLYKSAANRGNATARSNYERLAAKLQNDDMIYEVGN